MIRPAALVSAVFLLAVQGREMNSGIRPQVYTISRVISAQTQNIVISGSGFGYNRAYDGDSSYLWMVDQPPGLNFWRAGCPQQYGPCTTTLKVLTWTDSEIVVSGFTGNGQYPQNGDLVNFFIWNPQTGHGPAAAARVVE